jgi:plastocyanin
MLAAVALAAVFAAPAQAAPRSELVARQAVGPDTERLTYRYGPLLAGAGQNLIMLGPVTIEKPPGDVFVTRVVPELVRRDGTVPPVEQVHMHHAVLANASRPDATAPELPERFYGFAEEKTIAALPAGYGYPVRPTDVWVMNYMLHNGTRANETVYVEYTVDVVSRLSPTGQAMKPVRPLWLDVQNGKAYPVFDVRRGSGGDGRFTYPDEARDPYPAGVRPDEWRAPEDLTLVAGAGHLHPGGLWVDLHAERDGRRAHLFRSDAVYFDPNGPVSWDLAMTYTRPDWRVGVRRGDVLRVSTTYEAERASWYESMGLMLVYAASEEGPDPFAAPPDVRGEPTHGHLASASNHGGVDTGAPDPATFPPIETVDRRVGIADFAYLPGDAGASEPFRGVPEVEPGGSLRFGNLDATAQIFHTVTACRAPCNRSAGISYPLADGEVDFDSGSLGYGPDRFTAAAQRAEWETPKDLEPGTYTYFCRIHPFMRGAFRVRGERRAGGGAPGRPASRPASRRGRLRVLSRRLRVRRGAVRVRAACPAGGRCAGTAAVVRGRRVLARGRFAVRGGTRRTLRLRLTRAGRRAVRRAARVAAPRSRTATLRGQLVVRQRGLPRRSLLVAVRGPRR